MLPERVLSTDLPLADVPPAAVTRGGRRAAGAAAAAGAPAAAGVAAADVLTPPRSPLLGPAVVVAFAADWSELVRSTPRAVGSAMPPLAVLLTSGLFTGCPGAARSGRVPPATEACPRGIPG